MEVSTASFTWSHWSGVWTLLLRRYWSRWAASTCASLRSTWCVLCSYSTRWCRCSAPRCLSRRQPSGATTASVWAPPLLHWPPLLLLLQLHHLLVLHLVFESQRAPPLGLVHGHQWVARRPWKDCKRYYDKRWFMYHQECVRVSTLWINISWNPFFRSQIHSKLQKIHSKIVVDLLFWEWFPQIWEWFQLILGEVFFTNLGVVHLPVFGSGFH